MRERLTLDAADVNDPPHLPERYTESRRMDGLARCRLQPNGGAQRSARMTSLADIRATE